MLNFCHICRNLLLITLLCGPVLPASAAAQPEAFLGLRTVIYYVDDIAAVRDRLLQLGATAVTEIEDVGGGIQSASVRDPWGNVIGLIQNPHFDPTKVR